MLRFLTKSARPQPAPRPPAGRRISVVIPSYNHAAYIGQAIGSVLEQECPVDELIIVESMHVRKQLMFDRADAFVALPGGIGTLEELVEQLTWSQLGRHSKPIVLANIKGFWDPFLKLLEHMKRETFIRQGLDVHLNVVDRIEDVLPTILRLAQPYASAKEDEVLEKF